MEKNYFISFKRKYRDCPIYFFLRISICILLLIECKRNWSKKCKFLLSVTWFHCDSLMVTHFRSAGTVFAQKNQLFLFIRKIQEPTSNLTFGKYLKKAQKNASGRWYYSWKSKKMSFLALSNAYFVDFRFISMRKYPFSASLYTFYM